MIKVSVKLRPAILALIPYLLYLLILTMRPFEFFALNKGNYNLLESFYNQGIMDFVLNIILFIPFGFLVFLLIRNSSRKDYIKVLICVASGVSLSFIIETCQLFLPRDPELSDIFTNTTGALIGAIFGKLYDKKVIETVRCNLSKVQRSKSLLAAIIILYSAVFFVLSVFPIKYVDFRNWDPNFTFQIGSEANLDRPWVGKIYLLAIYDHALSEKEVYTNFKAGNYSSDGNRVKDGLTALYDFREGNGKTIHDISGFGLPVNLIIYDTSRVRWLARNGLQILDGTIIKSQGFAEKLYDAIKLNNQFSVETWIAPSKISQKEKFPGPARIVSFSKGKNLRNFTLAQNRKNIDFRVRTPLTGLSGSYINLKTADDFLTRKVQHLVATYKDGFETLFVNGTEHTRLALFDGIKLLGFFGNNVLSKAAFCFFFFFPLSFLCYAFFSNSFEGTTKTLIITVSLSFGLLLVIELLYVALFPNKNFDFALLYLALIVELLNTFFCRVCAESKLL